MIRPRLDDLSRQYRWIFAQVNGPLVAQQEVRQPPHVVQENADYEVHEPIPVIVRRCRREEVFFYCLVLVLDRPPFPVLFYQTHPPVRRDVGVHREDGVIALDVLLIVFRLARRYVDERHRCRSF